MTDAKPFRPSEAADALGERPGDFVLPLCLPQPSLMMGEDLAVVVLDTVHGQRIGLPLSLQGASDLHAVLGEALAMLRAQDEAE